MPGKPNTAVFATNTVRIADISVVTVLPDRDGLTAPNWKVEIIVKAGGRTFEERGLTKEQAIERRDEIAALMELN